MESLPDYYGVLGVPRYTSYIGIRRAYLRLAREHHPDLNPDEPGAVSEMSVINAAYATLSNPSRRADYDTRRNTVYLRLAPESVVYQTDYSHHPTYHSRSAYRHQHSAGLSALSAAIAALQRLLRYVTAALPA